MTMTKDQLAEVLGVREALVRQWTRDKTIPERFYFRDGDRSYRYAPVCVALGGLMLKTFFADVMQTAHGWRDQVKAVASTALSSHWINIAVRTVWHYPWLCGTAAIALLTLLLVEKRLDRFYSSYWHRVRTRLREAL